MPSSPDEARHAVIDPGIDRVENAADGAAGRVRVEPSGTVVETLPGEPIRSAALRAGFTWPSVCGGEASCRTCFVTVTAGAEHLSPVEPVEQRGIDEILRTRRTAGVVRLACQARATGEVVVVRRGVRPRSDNRHHDVVRPIP